MNINLSEQDRSSEFIFLLINKRNFIISSRHDDEIVALPH